MSEQRTLRVEKYLSHANVYEIRVFFVDSEGRREHGVTQRYLEEIVGHVAIENPERLFKAVVSDKLIAYRSEDGEVYWFHDGFKEYDSTMSVDQIAAIIHDRIESLRQWTRNIETKTIREYATITFTRIH